ncbi:hypothetical protein [Cytobacillus sp. NCCP-133]|uniref:hypothetical protein n=1 Tax=Cytobacillus sp. NCCP-133 TaxID=766848 RepID=UPI00223059A2|nr:hypothetical protein [Cytobacillus sp. NCCP-133]GLB61657.1 hypothetical protein NCCP133_37860 [Cytobacillus sp. NCCP-133]
MCNFRRRDDDVAGVSDRNRRRDFTFDARITIDRDDFCRAVDRCVEAEEDRRRRRRRSRCNWI